MQIQPHLLPLATTTALCAHMALSATNAPAALTCLVKGMVKHRARQRIEGIQMRTE